MNHQVHHQPDPSQLDEPDYSELEEILFKGFLTRGARLDDVPVVFKTLNSQEENKIQSRIRARSDREKAYEYSLRMIAYSIYLFNDINVLPERNTFVPMMIDRLKRVSSSVLEKTISFLGILNRRASNKVDLVEPYSYGMVSRHKWKSMKGTPPNDERITGIEGTEKLGLNTHQNLWVSLNRKKDREEEADIQWEMSAFTASAFAPDGVEKIKKKKRRDEKKQQREELMLYKSKGNRKLPDQGRIHVINESQEDLLDQIERQNRGEKDWHDMMIDQHEERIREGMKEKKQKMEEQAKPASDVQKQQVEAAKEAGEGMVAFDPSEVSDHVDRQKRRKKRALEEGRYVNRKQVKEQEETLKKWDILDEDPDTYNKPTPPSELNQGQPQSQPQPHGQSRRENQSTFEGTPLEDYYEEVDNNIDDSEGSPR